MKEKRILSVLLSVMVAVICASASVLPASAAQKFRFGTGFCDGAVFQRDLSCPVSGFGPAGSKITVTLLKENRSVASVTAVINERGRWSVELPAQPGSDQAYSITAKVGSSTRKITDLRFGEVWVIAGNTQLNRAATAVTIPSGLTEGKLRCFVPTPDNTVAQDPLDEVSGSWLDASKAENRVLWSAYGLEFAAHLQQFLNVPVGILQISSGVSSAASWLNPNAVTTSFLQKLQEEAIPGTTDQPMTAIYSCYNSRVAPLGDHAAAGVIWNTGENDLTSSLLRETCTQVLQTMETTFQHGETLKFRMLIPENTELTDESNRSRINGILREAVSELSHARYVPLYDLTSGVRVSQTDAQETGADASYAADPGKPAARLATLAEYERYGGKTYTFASLQKTEVEPDRIILRFTDVSGQLSQIGSQLHGFLLLDPQSGEAIELSAQLLGENGVILTLPDSRKSTQAELCYAYDEGLKSANLICENKTPVQPFRTQIRLQANEIKPLIPQEASSEISSSIAKQEDRSTLILLLCIAGGVIVLTVIGIIIAIAVNHHNNSIL